MPQPGEVVSPSLSPPPPLPLRNGRSLSWSWAARRQGWGTGERGCRRAETGGGWVGHADGSQGEWKRVRAGTPLGPSLLLAGTGFPRGLIIHDLLVLATQGCRAISEGPRYPAIGVVSIFTAPPPGPPYTTPFNSHNSQAREGLTSPFYR